MHNPIRQWSAIFIALRTGLKLNFFFVDRPLKNHIWFSNKTARIRSGCKSAKLFRVSLKKKSSICDGANSAKCFKFNVKTQTDRLQTSPVFAYHCFNAFILEKYAASCEPLADRQPSRGPVLPTTALRRIELEFVCFCTEQRSRKKHPRKKKTIVTTVHRHLKFMIP